MFTSWENHVWEWSYISRLIGQMMIKHVPDRVWTFMTFYCHLGHSLVRLSQNRILTKYIGAQLTDIHGNRSTRSTSRTRLKPGNARHCKYLDLETQFIGFACLSYRKLLDLGQPVNHMGQLQRCGWFPNSHDIRRVKNSS